MEDIIGAGWAEIFNSDEAKILKGRWDEIQKRRGEIEDEILPLEGENSGIYHALKVTDFNDVKVLIIGQDPYPNRDDAHGLAFSKKSGGVPASLKNIFLEIENNTGVKNTSGNLIPWAKQGVLLLNRVLSFEKNLSLAKRLRFWEETVDIIIQKLLDRGKPLVVMLWGGPANSMEIFHISKDEEYKKKNIYILRSSHPSNMGNAKNTRITIEDKVIDAFMGCGHFSKCNVILQNAGLEPIDWSTGNCTQAKLFS